MMWNKLQVVPLTIHVPSFKADMNVKDKFQIVKKYFCMLTIAFSNTKSY